uniref:PPM-type phosphatase domain-containing protein n=2 Tax=Rhizophagus irregularis (strain DAOM 181602 / DAOM 197198 / MUCL 43194) TaxID=747089 RepID=U9UJ60_RHIID
MPWTNLCKIIKCNLSKIRGYGVSGNIANHIIAYSALRAEYSTAVVTVITPNKIVYVGNLGNSRAVMSNFDRESQRIIIQAGRNPENYNVSVLLMTLKTKRTNFHCLPDMIMFRKVDTDTDFLVLARDGIWDRMSFEDVINFINKDIKIDKALSKACEINYL